MQPFYYLRPNKYIDRELFIQTLSRLHAQFCFQKYTYIGFGSYLFDDFKSIHRQLGIKRMFSFEKEEKIYQRACFNKPLSCIKIYNQDIEEFISSEDLPKKAIYWLDFTDPKQLAQQISLFCTLLNKAYSGNIVRLTLNVNIPSLEKLRNSDGTTTTPPPNERARKLINDTKSKLSQYLGNTELSEQTILKTYPTVILQCLNNAAMQTLSSTQSKIAYPLFTAKYADSTEMLTHTLLILDKKESLESIRKSLTDMPYETGKKESILEIKAPQLSLKERIEINQRMSGKYIQSKLKKFTFSGKETISQEEIKSYLKFYKYYPNFHHFNL